ncbi:MAG: hypothetical protein ACYC1C_12550 [Chloroflexota bacterium]
MVRWHRGLSVVLLFAFLLASLFLATVPAAAQDLSFSLDRNISRVYVNKDGSIDVEYWLTFRNDRGAPTIDIVDVGMPTKNYVLSTIVADVDGAAVKDIRKSEWISPGAEFHLGSRSIRGGQTGTLHLRARVNDMVFPDSQDDSYASVEFAPHYYGSDFVHGSTYLEVSFYLPPGVTPDEPRYHQEQFTSAAVKDGQVVYTWVKENARPDRQYMFGASFPKQYVDKISQPSIDFDPIIEAGVVIAVFLAVIGAVIITPILAIGAARRRRLDYLPPVISVEGVEIRRGLTAPEAAVLMELPLDRVLTLISFGLIRKGALRVLTSNPLRVEALKPEPEGLKPYEVSFLRAVGPDGRLDEAILRAMVVDLVKSVNRQMKGFSGRDTLAYYRSIVDKAWERVKSSGEADLSDEMLAETIEWASLDREFERKAPEVFVGRSFRRPVWWGNYVPRTSHPTGHSAPGRSVSLPDVQMPTLPGSQFANSIVSGMEGMAAGVVGNVESFTSGVTQITNPPPPPTRSSSGRGGGGGCACACACAGCACACAGGGR